MDGLKVVGRLMDVRLGVEFRIHGIRVLPEIEVRRIVDLYKAKNRRRKYKRGEVVPLQVHQVSGEVY